MKSLMEVKLSSLTESASKLNVAKAGKAGRVQYVDPFILGETYDTTITGCESVVSKGGFPQVKLTLSIGGDESQSGSVYIGLPVELEGMVIDDAKFNKIGDGFLKFLRAVDPGTWNVFQSIDKTDALEWKYLDGKGKPMTQKARDERATAINKDVANVALALFQGEVSLVGCKVGITKRANPMNEKWPFNNFSPVKSA